MGDGVVPSRVVLGSDGDYLGGEGGQNGADRYKVLGMTTSSATAATTSTTSITTADAPVVTPAALASRRGFLAGAAAASAVGVGGSVLTGAYQPAAANILPTVTPVWSEAIRRSFGVAVQPQMLKTPYVAATAWPQYAAEMNATYIRGKYSTGASLREVTASITAQCRALGLKWVVTLIPEDWSMSLAQLGSVLAHIRDNAADVCIGVEGMNEPNHNRDGSPVRPDWAAAAVAYQKVIWDFVTTTPALSHVSVVGPSLQMGGTDPYVDFEALAAAGLPGLMHYAGMHSYPGGLKPDSKVDTRLGYVRDAWGAVPTWVSETGYTNAMNAPMVGPRPVPTDVSAAYGPRSLMDYYTRGCNSARYELLSEPDPTNAEPEYSYGLLNCPSNDPATWTVKPEYEVMRDLLGALKDPAPTYTPSPVPLQVTAPSNVKWLLTAKADGTTTLYAYLNASIWDVQKRVRLNPSPVDVKITDRAGTRTVKVGATLTAITVR